MTFSVFLNFQSKIFEELLVRFLNGGAWHPPEPKKVIDFTYGTGALWKGIRSGSFEVTKCDARGDGSAVLKRDLLKDEYSDLSLHDAAVFDPPYLIGRQSFDYSMKLTSQGRLVPMQLQGKRSWGAQGVEHYTANPTVQTFIDRVKALNVKAPMVLRPGGCLFVKVMDVHHKGRVLPHHITIYNELTPNFELVDIGVYIKEGASTWVAKYTLQTRHGYWMIFRLRTRNGILS